MCARYLTADENQNLARTYGVEIPAQLVLPHGMIFPHTPAPVIVQGQNGREVRLMSYSLVPAWSKVKKPKFVTYNARLEEILTKPTWKGPFQNHHCLVPMKSFIESVYEGPYAGHNIEIQAPDDHILTAAGIWETWIDRETGEVLDSFAILTREPPQSIRSAGHDRCPIFLPESHWQKWIGEKCKGPEWIEFLEELSPSEDWKFTPREELKSFKKQLSLLDE